jgi:hypothetical protein
VRPACNCIRSCNSLVSAVRVQTGRVSQQRRRQRQQRAVRTHRRRSASIVATSVRRGERAAGVETRVDDRRSVGPRWNRPLEGRDVSSRGQQGRPNARREVSEQRSMRAHRGVLMPVAQLVCNAVPQVSRKVPARSVASCDARTQGARAFWGGESTAAASTRSLRGRARALIAS